MRGIYQGCRVKLEYKYAEEEERPKWIDIPFSEAQTISWGKDCLKDYKERARITRLFLKELLLIVSKLEMGEIDSVSFNFILSCPEAKIKSKDYIIQIEYW